MAKTNVWFTEGCVYHSIITGDSWTYVGENRFGQLVFFSGFKGRFEPLAEHEVRRSFGDHPVADGEEVSNVYDDALKCIENIRTI